MANKISIIGSGKTVSTLVLILALRNVGDEIWLFDSNRRHAPALSAGKSRMDEIPFIEAYF